MENYWGRKVLAGLQAFLLLSDKLSVEMAFQIPKGNNCLEPAKAL